MNMVVEDGDAAPVLLLSPTLPTEDDGRAGAVTFEPFPPVVLYEPYEPYGPYLP